MLFSMGFISVHALCLIPVEKMPGVVRECPEGVMICSGFPSALEKGVVSFAFQKKAQNPFWHYAFLPPPRAVSELVYAAILTFTSPFCAAPFPCTLCPGKIPECSSRAAFSEEFGCSGRAVSGGAFLLPCPPHSDAQ